MIANATNNLLTLVGKAHHAHGGFDLLGSVVSPYFHMINPRKVGIGPSRDIRFISVHMTLKVLVAGWVTAGGNPSLDVFIESDDATIKANTNIPVAYAYGDTDTTLQAIANSTITTFCTSLGLPSPTIDWQTTTPTDLAAAILAAAPAAPVASALSLSLQTSTGAVGTQVSSTRNSYVMLNGNVSTTASIGGNAAGDIILEVAPTNSATAGDWVEWGRIGNSQTISLALALNSVQVTKGMAVCFVPAGYYVKARTAGSGTVSYILTNAKQILN